MIDKSIQEAKREEKERVRRRIWSRKRLILIQPFQSQSRLILSVQFQKHGHEVSAFRSTFARDRFMSWKTKVSRIGNSTLKVSFFLQVAR